MLDPTGKARDIASQGKTSTSPHWTPLHSTIRPCAPKAQARGGRCAAQIARSDRPKRQ
jgi:hypothetical protein